MTPEEQLSYAKELILSHAKDVEFLTIHETYEYKHDEELSNEDAFAVDELIRAAKVTVEWVD
jgi:hypothetical protein